MVPPAINDARRKRKKKEPQPDNASRHRLIRRTLRLIARLTSFDRCQTKESRHVNIVCLKDLRKNSAEIQKMAIESITQFKVKAALYKTNF